MREFTDPIYGYSIRYPTASKPYLRTTSKAEPPARLTLCTLNKSMLIVSVYRLPQSVTSHSEFELIGRDHVESVVDAYLKSFNLTNLGDKKEGHSDLRSMRFWQGTSAGIGILISLHAIRYGSDFMVNIVYVSGDRSKEEVVAVDAVMNSLSFPSR
jgi:hypothetical protein